MTHAPANPQGDPQAVDERAFLAALGQQVRTRREAAGLSRRALSARSGLSERYLAQLELGAGNVSVLLLRKVGEALACPLPALLNGPSPLAAPERSPLQAVVTMLQGLDQARLDQALELLVTRFGKASAARRAHVALIGLRGAGKSTIGAQLARHLGVRFIELDAEIERDLGVDLAGIFSLYGQDAYRDAEARVLQRLIASPDPFVLATGGSIVTAPASYAQLRANCFTVWLRAEPADHMARVIEQGDMRPMHGREHAMHELQAILKARESLYRLADRMVDSSQMTVDACVEAIAQAVQT